MSKISQIKEELALLVDYIENTVEEFNKLRGWDEDAIELTTSIIDSIGETKVEIENISGI